MTKKPLEALQDQVCPYCHEVFGAFGVAPVVLADGDRVVAFRATCSHCGVTASLGADILVPEVRHVAML